MNSSPRDSWRVHGNQRERERLRRDLRRSLIVLGLIALAAALLLFLFPPFFAAKTHLVLVGTGNMHSLDAPTIPFVGEDLQALQTIDTAVVHPQDDLWSDARSATQLGNTIAATGVSGTDALVVYLTAHGVSKQGEAFLLCESFDLRNPDAGRISLNTVLQQISTSNAATKLLVLNAGSIDYDPRLGMVVNEFPRLLEEAVTSTGDPSLWVYCSHSPLQRSQVSQAARRSIFGLFVSEGLRGAADLNRDRSIALNELTRFATANVSRWVGESSDHAAAQTPQLCWGGGKNVPNDSPTLLTLARDQPDYALDVRKIVGRDSLAAAGSGADPNDLRSSGLMTRRSVASNLPPAAGGSAASASGIDISAAGNSEAASASESTAATGDATTDDDAAAGDAQQAGATGPGGDGNGEEAAGAAGAGGDETDDGQKTPRDPLARPRKLLAEIWQLRDQAQGAWAIDNPSENPIENVPHLWREFEAELIAFEQRLRSGAGSDVGRVEAILTQTLAAKQPADATGRLSGLWQTAGAFRLDATKRAKQQAHSIALATMFDTELANRVTKPMATLGAALEQDAPTALDAWMKKEAAGELGRYAEIKSLQRLAAATDLDWPLLQLAAKSTLAAERSAALDLISPDWVRSSVQRGDQLRCFAEELLFDRVGADWRPRARRLLTQAAESYAQAESDFVLVRKAEYLRDRVVDKLPHYLAWYQRTRWVADGSRPSQLDLDSLLATTLTLSQLLGSPDASRIDELSDLCADVQSLVSQIESASSNESIQSLIDRTPVAGDGWRTEQLLRTPLLSASARQQLQYAWQRIDRDLASAFVPASVNPDETDPSLATGSLNADDWAFLLELAEMESQFLAMGSRGDEAPSLAAVRQALEIVRQRRAEAIEIYGGGPLPAGTAELESLWSAYRDLGEAFAQVYQRDRLPNSAVRRGNWQNTSQAVAALRLVDPRDAWRVRDLDVQSLSAAARLRSTLAWQARRLESVAAYRSPADEDALLAQADAYLKTSDSIARLTRDPRPPNPIAVRADALVDLEYQSADTIALEVKNQAADDLQLLLDYDRELIELVEIPIETAADVAVTSPSDRANGEPVAQHSKTDRPLRVDAGSSVQRRFRIVRRANATQSSRLIIDARPSNSSQWAENPLLARQVVDITLPVAELRVQQGDQWEISGVEPLQVRPFPNRINSLQFGVVHRGSTEKQVSLGLYALDQTPQDMDTVELATLIAGKEPLATYSTSVAADGTPAFPGEKKEEQESDNGEDGKPAEQQGDTPAAKEEAPEEAAPIKSQPLDEGMLAVLTDIASGQTTYRLLDFRVQRPRRFLVPQVDYNAWAERIEISVVARDVSWLPADGPIRISCRLETPLAAGMQGKLQGEISRTQPSTELFLNVPAPPKQPVRLLLDVDNYPRAFVFNVPCGKDMTAIPEATDLTEVRLSTPSEGRYIPATDLIPLAVQIDAPVGTFERDEDAVEFRVFELADADGPGPTSAPELPPEPPPAAPPEPVPAPEPSDLATDLVSMQSDKAPLQADVEPTPTAQPPLLQLLTDRDVQVGFVDSTPEGVVNLHASVADFELELPTGRLENVDIQVETTMQVRDHVSPQIPPLELYVDTAPPVVGPARTVNYTGFVPVGQELLLSVWAWDAGCGVEKVEAVFDLTGSGEFPAEGAVAEGILVSGRQWGLAINSGADTGAKTLLVRAIDYVGNASDPIRLPLQIVSLEGAALQASAQKVEIAGMVLFRDKPIPEADVTLTELADPAASNPEGTASGVMVSTNDKGRYSLPNVAPGEYQIKARAVIHNRVRRIEQQVSVKPGPKRTVHVDISLP